MQVTVTSPPSIRLIRLMVDYARQSMGPNVATPDLFAEALFGDTSTWTVIDRGPFEALVPITEVMENMLSYFDVDSPGKAKLEVRSADLRDDVSCRPPRYLVYLDLGSSSMPSAVQR